MDDDSYESIFEPIIAKVMETFQPSAVVLQCGADSLTGDRLGCFNLTVKGTFSFFELCRLIRDFFFFSSIRILRLLRSWKMRGISQKV